jgi:AGCS family alanine or glycine:cation symporter
MEQFLAGLLNVVQTVNAYLSDYILIVLLVGIGIFYTIKTRFVQIRCFKQGMKQVFGNIKLNGGKQKGGMSSFQAFTTAVAAQVGTGNIIGASGAILAGGPGAIFWMWVIAFFGMATNYSEAVLAQRTRMLNSDGSVSGGPIYYIKQAFKGGFGKFLAGFFAIATIIALGFVGSMVQSNSIAGAVNEATGISPWIVGIVVAILAGLILIGGVSRLASVTEKIVPIMAVVYLLGGLIVICCNITVLPEAIWMIFKYAFVPEAIIGGGIGAALKTAISQGAKRGLFSNEAGMGSTPHAHAQANVDNAHQQGVSAMIGVFFDTFVVLTMTALIVITTLYAGDGVLSSPDKLAAATAGGMSKANLVKNAIATLFNGSNVGLTIGGIFVAVCLFFFAFSTILSWNLFGKINFTYLFGKKSSIVYMIIAILFVFLGSVFQNDLVWELTDFFNYLMVLPNVMALFMLSKIVVDELKTNGKKSAIETPNQALSDKIAE